MMLLHVEQFDGKNISRPLEFTPGHAKRWRLLLPIPPFRDRRQGLQGRKRAVTQHTQEVQVRQAGMKIAGYRRAKQNDALDVRPRCFPDPFHKLFDFLFRIFRTLVFN